MFSIDYFTNKPNIIEADSKMLWMDPKGGQASG